MWKNRSFPRIPVPPIPGAFASLEQYYLRLQLHRIVAAMNFRLFIFLACLVLVQSYIDLKEFCQKSPSLRTISETRPIYNMKEYTCKIELPFIAQDNTMAEYMCSYYAPFPTFDVKMKPDTVECVYQTNRNCPNGEHLIQGVCIKIVREKMNFMEYNTSACKDGYNTLKVMNRDMARWISTLDVVRKTKGIWIDQATRADNNPSPSQNEAKYLNLVLELGKNKLISSILHTKQEEQLFGACVSEKHGTYVEQPDSNANAKYFLTENLYYPTSINGYIKNGSDTFKEMDAMCKKLNPFSMLATTIPPETHIEGMEPNSLVYVGVRAFVETGFRDAELDCSKTKEPQILAPKFQAVLHPIGGKINTTGVVSSQFKHGYPHNACSDVPKTAVAYDGKNLINIIPIARLKVACVTGRLDGLKYVDPCGKGGDYNAAIGQCECKPQWVDITTMNVTAAKNYQKGELCVPETPCGEEGENNFIIFVLDASDETHSYASYEGLKSFVRMAKTLIHNKNRVAFVAYGRDNYAPRGEVRCDVLEPHWIGGDYDAKLNKVTDGYIGYYTNCVDGFDQARKYLEKFTQNPANSQTKRIVIHIGDGIPTGDHRGSQLNQIAYNLMASYAHRVISVGMQGNSDAMKYDWHTEGDYINFTGLRYEDLNVDNMQFVMRKVCNEMSLPEMVNHAYGTN